MTNEPVVPYDGAAEHLADELTLARAFLVGHVRAERERADGASAAPSLEDVVSATRTIERRVRASRQAGRPTPFDRVRRVFGLSPSEDRVLWLLIALEVEPDLREMAQFLVGDPSRPVTDVGLLRRLVYGDRDHPRCLAELGPGGRLTRFALIERADDRGRELAFVLRRVRVADRVVELVHGIDRLDRTLDNKVELRTTGPSLVELVAPGELKAEVASLVASAVRASGEGELHPIVLLAGTEGSGRRALAVAAARALGAPSLIVRCEELPTEREALERLGRVLVREAILAGGLIVLAGIDVSRGPDRPTGVALDEALLGGAPGPVVATCGRDPGAAITLRRGMVRIEVPTPDEAMRATLWRRGVGDAEDAVAWAAGRYNLTPGVIERAASSAVARSRARSAAAVERVDVHAGIRTALEAKMSGLGTAIDWRPRWDDLVLPEDTLLEVRELIARVKHRRLVLDQWGFGAKLMKGLGLSALFYGPPGTGKSMVAGLIAGELGLDLYQVDLSRIVSKWVGETEKNLASLFDAAESGHTILLFDEADSLFAKRTEVKSSVDRYANLEVNYLLQRIEAFAGITILTTNHDTAIDEAFRRRLAFRVSFPLPEEEERLRLWRDLIPPQASLAADVPFGLLAERYAMSGGYIRNAVLRAAFLAADEGVPISMAHLGRAAAMEYAAMGKVIHQDVVGRVR